MKVQFLRAVLLASFLAALVGAPVAQAIEEETAEFRYDMFAERLSTGQFARDYPKAVKNLDSPDSKLRVAALKTLAATGEIAAIPFVVPQLDSKDGDVRIWAGVALQKLVATHELKRRDMSRPTRVVIKPLGPKDTDLRPLAWVIGKMLRKPDDGNTQAHAATMIGYLGLREFEDDLKLLLKSRHPAVQNAAKNAMEMMDVDYPQRPFSEEELAAAKKTAESFGKAFLAKNEKQLTELLVAKEAVGNVHAAKLVEKWGKDYLYKEMVNENVTHFKELRSTFGNTSRATVSGFEAGSVSQSSAYSTKVRLMKDAYVILAFANKSIVKIRIEEMIIFDGKCYIMQVD
jgi:HEAT repeat protein